MTSDFCLSMKTHVKRVASSTMVRKYAYPTCVAVDKGPQMSTCIRSRGLGDTWLFEEKESILCFAKGQVVQEWELKDFDCNNVLQWFQNIIRRVTKPLMPQKSIIITTKEVRI